MESKNPPHHHTKSETLKQLFLYIMAIAYVLAGINHFWHPDFYIKMIEAFLPWPLGIIYISGIAEIAGGIGLLIPATRRYAAFALIFLLISIFPANIYMAMHPQQWPELSPWALYLRLPLQLVLIYLVNLYTTQANSKTLE